MFNSLFGNDFFTDFEKEIYNEMREFLEYRNNKKNVKEVSPPVDEQKCCEPEDWCEPQTCCEPEDWCEAEVCCEPTLMPTNENCCGKVACHVNADGWTVYENNDGSHRFERRLTLPCEVDKEHVQVGIINKARVIVNYEQGLRVDTDVHLEGSRTVSGCYQFNLPKANLDINTFKAKLLDYGVLRISVNELDVRCAEGSYTPITVEN